MPGPRRNCSFSAQAQVAVGSLPLEPLLHISDEIGQIPAQRAHFLGEGRKVPHALLAVALVESGGHGPVALEQIRESVTDLEVRAGILPQPALAFGGCRA